MINFCWDLDCPKQKVIRGVFSSCKTKSICTFFGYMFFEKIIMTLFKCICTVFGNIFFEKIVMTLSKSICTVFGDVFFEDDCYGIG